METDRFDRMAGGRHMRIWAIILMVAVTAVATGAFICSLTP